MARLYFDSYACLTILTVLVVSLLVWSYLRKWKKPHLFVSDISQFKLEKMTLRERLSNLPRILLLVTLTLFVIAYIDPHRYVLNGDADFDDVKKNSIPTEGIAIYLVLDNSLSMSEEISISTPSGRRKTISKMDILKDMTKQFVVGDKGVGLKGRKNDLIGIVSFARGAQVLSPLTLDHNAIVKELNKLDVNRDESQRGTALGYAIFKTANLIEATRHFNQDRQIKGDSAYEIKNSVIVLITDGFQETNPEDYANPLRSVDLIDAVEYAKGLGVRLYLINIDPKITSMKYSDHRKFFNLLTQTTGGNFFYVDSTHDLSKIYAEIDKLEKSDLADHTQDNMETLPHIYRRISYYKYLITAGMFSLFLFILLQTTVLKRVP